jgi:hypothetical protein
VNSLFEALLAKQPWIVRWTFYLMIGLVTILGGAFTLGWQAVPHVESYVDGRIERYAGPRREFRDQQIKGLHDRLDYQQAHFDDKLSSMDRKLDILIGKQ